jgi:hypothetical protein
MAFIFKNLVTSYQIQDKVQVIYAIILAIKFRML